MVASISYFYSPNLFFCKGHYILFAFVVVRVRVRNRVRNRVSVKVRFWVKKKAKNCYGPISDHDRAFF